MKITNNRVLFAVCLSVCGSVFAAEQSDYSWVPGEKWVVKNYQENKYIETLKSAVFSPAQFSDWRKLQLEFEAEHSISIPSLIGAVKAFGSESWKYFEEPDGDPAVLAAKVEEVWVEVFSNHGSPKNPALPLWGIMLSEFFVEIMTWYWKFAAEEIKKDQEFEIITMDSVEDMCVGPAGEAVAGGQKKSYHKTWSWWF